MVKSHLSILNEKIPVRMDPAEPPFEEAYKDLLVNIVSPDADPSVDDNHQAVAVVTVEQCELPLIDLGKLSSEDEGIKEKCKMEMARASKEWGFFQVVNHGVSSDTLKGMREEQLKTFREPFYKKQNNACRNMLPGSYRWGTPSATCLEQLSWSEAFHIPLGGSITPGASSTNVVCPLSSKVRRFASSISELAQKLTNILAERLGYDFSFFGDNCLPNTCYLRMNRYPACPNYSHVFGLMPHTDSDFLTILYQDDVGGLQLLKDGRWFAVKPNPEALIVNIGDLFQAWSSGIYKSVEHRVVANQKVERFSTAYFLCPSYDAVIQSKKGPSVYRKFTFGEYRKQVQDDVKLLGHKVGLSRFLICPKS